MNWYNLKEKLKDKEVLKLIAVGVGVLLLLSYVVFAVVSNANKPKTTAGAIKDFPINKDAKYTVPAKNKDTIKQVITEKNYGDIILFTTAMPCPQCETLSSWINTNNVASKVNYTTVSVYNKDTTPEDNAVIKKVDDACQIPFAHSGVPMLFDAKNNKCIYNETNITAFFQNLIK
ncbi:MAG: hypothetical protein WCO23_00805 [bacterium]